MGPGNELVASAVIPPPAEAAPEPPAHRHNLIHTAYGIGCRGCDLWVPKPPGMPDYTGAAMGDWNDDLPK